mmetsp:Transcript_6237/g.24103  ORF Transcript_6237/g.24103 Transcript_6237/m.24103 type:complete len:229 (-) Transcript_6237:197-883(-)
MPRSSTACSSADHCASYRFVPAVPACEPDATASAAASPSMDGTCDRSMDGSDVGSAALTYAFAGGAIAIAPPFIAPPLWIPFISAGEPPLRSWWWSPLAWSASWLAWSASSCFMSGTPKSSESKSGKCATSSSRLGSSNFSIPCGWWSRSRPRRWSCTPADGSRGSVIAGARSCATPAVDCPRFTPHDARGASVVDARLYSRAGSPTAWTVAGGSGLARGIARGSPPK